MPSIERKVRQLDHDVQAIYEMLASIAATQQRQSNRLMEIVATQSEQSRLLTDQTGELTQQTSKLDQILDLLRPR